MLQQIRKRGQVAAACVIAVLLATGCFQSAGVQLQATSVAQGFATFTPQPSLTPVPSETEALSVEETETVLPAISVETEVPLIPVETETPFSIAAAPTENVEQAANVQEQIEPPEMTATALIQRATEQAALEMTATADAIATAIIPTLPATAIPTIPGYPTALPSGGSCIYVVQPGDNLFRISLRYGTTVYEIANLNGIANIQLIIVGQQLTIPNCSGGGQVPPPPSGGGQIHVVRQGENLFRISLSYGVSLSAVLAANPQITNPNLIFIDQQIVIP